MPTCVLRGRTGGNDIEKVIKAKEPNQFSNFTVELTEQSRTFKEDAKNENNLKRPKKTTLPRTSKNNTNQQPKHGPYNKTEKAAFDGADHADIHDVKFANRGCYFCMPCHGSIRWRRMDMNDTNSTSSSDKEMWWMRWCRRLRE
ncbi:hypothetical protein V6N13_088677 [Hibiscus sabdariffa]